MDELTDPDGPDAASSEDGEGRRRGPVDGRMSLIEHLIELRSRAAKSLAALAVCVIVVFIFWEPVYDFLRQPYCRTEAGQKNCNLFAIGIFDQFKVRLRVAFIGGTIASAPVWLYQLGAFITPALHRKEKKYAGGFLAASLVLFAVGITFSYLTVSRGLDFLLEVGGGDITTLVSIQSYLSFLTLCLLAFGVAFEFPVLVMFLNFVGLFPSSKMRSMRRTMIVGIFAASALITPSQDPFTFCFMAIPLYLLYEGCIVIARVRERAQRRRNKDSDFSHLADDEASPIDTNPSKL